ncbi:hypothetical protein MAPG_08326 [Magnaporthiopsis poae ATCC 64411]|uniref:Uncharacterized protein n=1 Tax=Magnaporthiopsis poae (strain ATCC 64411 / 73-15) TaxID=644358 RepID=A0A0C4E727_MAGP6|nr:hypothetical protein MAPG_08326 [Magnaporthiopsis poae ATCC 64411]
MNLRSGGVGPSPLRCLCLCDRSKPSIARSARPLGSLESNMDGPACFFWRSHRLTAGQHRSSSMWHVPQRRGPGVTTPSRKTGARFLPFVRCFPFVTAQLEGSLPGFAQTSQPGATRNGVSQRSSHDNFHCRYAPPTNGSHPHVLAVFSIELTHTRATSISPPARGHARRAPSDQARSEGRCPRPRNFSSRRPVSCTIRAGSATSDLFFQWIMPLPGLPSLPQSTGTPPLRLCDLETMQEAA